jgi:hypothetical protein
MTNCGVEFIEFQKMPRWSRRIIITEKIDGTNGVVYVGEDGTMLAGSRTRWVQIGNDNHGFAGWVEKNKEELKGLGVGYHHGEWWGQGIQRGYGLKEKRFSLLNSSKWTERLPTEVGQNQAPKCCHVVPIIYDGIMSESAIHVSLAWLKERGSVAAPGYMNPEGVVIYHVQGNLFFKKTLLNDEVPKGLVQ